MIKMLDKLHMVLLGCKPSGRFTEQHDIFFGIGADLRDLKPAMNAFWKEAKGKLHVDAWREVTVVDGFAIEVRPRTESVESNLKLFFVNLGGYRGQDFEEYHYKQLVVAQDVAGATKKAKSSVFFREHISPHIDDKYGLDVDDIFSVEDALPEGMRSVYQLVITPIAGQAVDDDIAIGYLKFSSLK
ncbi:hypothetical protein DI53_2820 [Sphingobacterium deserti]|uniref:DUF1543 domain-containing protein n=2 Tax=Sphingobacterium deserti TaxID=1229276 RepID=A0A0B8T632_9SPHI|nr:hypothetical protein DI53_2820 [Sphingobacterium deserti]